ncbi:MAG: DUF5107 domain-containing protein [Spirochaetaceae bacterium]|nr:MAG: DUF5107 domain-containing protein [Spirochaetaceae bacterium]
MNDNTLDVISIDDAPRPCASGSDPCAWTQRVVIPTYQTGQPCPHPMYFEHRVYQGSSGAVYPLPITEEIAAESEPVEYEAVFLENEFIKVMVLPELGGRIHMAYDKKLDYHFVYFNRVIKPALVGLVGPWIAGGIEFNWPQHHRPSTCMPVEYRIETDDSGRATVSLREVDRMYGLGVETRVSLGREDTRIRIDATVSNRTATHQTFLWWANPAVSVNDEYQAIFPPDVQAVFDHGKRDVSRFPIATGTYYKIDYAHGVDISWYRNIPVPTSYMAYYSHYDFVGGYDHARNAGILHAASNRISPGKKMWTWGTGDFASAWEQNLTDADGPYIELMTGVFSENQPDFTWIAPGETTSFTQYFYPFWELPHVLCATEDGAIGFVSRDGNELLTVYAAIGQTTSIRILEGNTVHELESRRLEAHTVHEWHLPVERSSITGIDLLRDGSPTLSYRIPQDSIADIPEPASAPPTPDEAPSAEVLYQIGAHLEQYRHATISPDVYYKEALQRDPGYSAAHLALARLALSSNRPGEALEHAERAVERLTSWNNNPASGWPHYYLGLCYRANGRLSDAERAFDKATWCEDSRAAAHVQITLIHLHNDDPSRARRNLDRAVETRPSLERANNLLLFLDPTSAPAKGPAELVSDYCLPHGAGTMHRHTWNLMELLCELSEASQYRRIEDTVKTWDGEDVRKDAIPYYFAAWAAGMSMRPSATVNAWLNKAEQQSAAGVFPVRSAELEVLAYAVAFGEQCPMAHYYLGNAEYHRRNYSKAFDLWTFTTRHVPGFAAAHRNRAIYLFNKAGNVEEARNDMELACTLAPGDARILAEFDELARRSGVSPRQRKVALESKVELVSKRDDLTIQLAAIETTENRPQEALSLLANHRFTPWEGGEGAVPGEYRRAVIRLALHGIGSGQFDDAIKLLESAREYPDNLCEGKLPFTSDNELDWWIGVCKTRQDAGHDAKRFFEAAGSGSHTPSLSMYYNDVPARAILYQGLALQELGDATEARRRFFSLRDYGERHIRDHIQQDYFAVSFPELVTFEIDLTERHRSFCRLVIALGSIGLAERDIARAVLLELLNDDPNNVDAVDHLYLLDHHELLLH